MANKFTALSPAVRLNYRSQGSTLLEFHRSKDKFVRNLIGPLGSGKTQACIFEVMHCIDTQEPDKHGYRRSRWVVCRNTYPDLQTTTIKDWRAITDQLPIGHFSNGVPPTWTCEYRKGDGTTVKGEVMFVSFDGYGDEKKARGMQLTGVYFEELKELSKINVDMLQSRVTRFPPKAEVPNAKFHIISCSNAPERDHWLAKMAFDIKPDGWWFGIQPGGVQLRDGKWQTNPGAENLQNLKSDYYANLVAGKKESWVRQNLANEFVYSHSGRAIHPDFNEQLHVMGCAPTIGLPITIGVDFGRTPAATYMQQQHNGQWQVFREVTTTNTSAYKFGQVLAADINKTLQHFTVQVIGDPAGSDMSQTRDETCIEMLSLAGLDAIPAPTNDFEERTGALDSLLLKLIDGQPAIIFDPSCRMLIKGLSGAYQFKRIQVVGDERYRDKPDKGPESHVCESCHYGLLGAGVGQALFDQAWGDSGETYNLDKRYFE